MSAPVDVLAVFDKILRAAHCIDVQPPPDDEVVAARAAVAELIEAVRAAEALAVCCMAIDCYSRDELYDSAEANRAIFAKALARIGGAE